MLVLPIPESGNIARTVELLVLPVCCRHIADLWRRHPAGARLGLGQNFPPALPQSRVRFASVSTLALMGGGRRPSSLFPSLLL